MSKKIYFEEDALNYELGKKLYEKFKDYEWIKIDNHNNIPELRNKTNSEFLEMKKYIIIGIRKTHKYVPNNKISDYLVPYTSSGCSASCMYCYLVCNYNKCSYLRLFVNREEMMRKLMKTAFDKKDCVFEIGSNSDLVLENTITDNLFYTIETFGKIQKGYITFPTKFNMVDSLLNLKHNGRTIFRMSVNPQEIISQIEIGTSPLDKRIEALIKVYEAGYKIGLLIAPIILVEGWKKLYIELLKTLSEKLPQKLQKDLNIEIIFMTYSFIHRKINEEAFGMDLYSKDLMTGRGMGKYCYKQEHRHEGEEFFKQEIKKYLPNSNIIYIV